MSHVTEYDRKPVFSQYHRADMETIKSIKENGIEKLLGEVKNFRANEEMNRFIPEQARLAVSWVRLAKNEKLDVHVHPISSLYIICEGKRSCWETALTAGPFQAMSSAFRQARITASSARATTATGGCQSSLRSAGSMKTQASRW